MFAPHRKKIYEGGNHIYLFHPPFVMSRAGNTSELAGRHEMRVSPLPQLWISTGLGAANERRISTQKQKHVLLTRYEINVC
jgi:hypothetical protein